MLLEHSPPLCHRLISHPAGKGKRRRRGESDFIALIDGIHQLIKERLVLVWNRLNTHVSRRMRELAADRDGPAVFLLPAYSPDPNPVEDAWAHVKRSLANLTVIALYRLEALVRNRLKRLQYQSEILDGFSSGTGLTLTLSPADGRTHHFPAASGSMEPRRRPRAASIVLLMFGHSESRIEYVAVSRIAPSYPAVSARSTPSK
ncbi:transposase [Streptomyces sp. NPDC096339]|uniref:transposase n=1 Tax=Streptomyces sp. NPDC096339 TaxID=3366086 RepID=UPI0037FDB505